MRLLFAMFLMLAIVPAALAQEKERPKGAASSPKELVQALGSLEFATRAAAEKELLRLGSAAVPAIQEGLKSKDINVQTRCERLLINIDKQEWQRKVDDYLADAKGERRHDLPLLKEYEKLVGKGDSTRKLFGECLLTNRQLMTTVAADAKEGRKAFADHCDALFHLHNRNWVIQNVTKVDMAVLFLVSAHLSSVRTDFVMPLNLYYVFLFNGGFYKALRDNQNGEALRTVFLAWADALKEGNWPVQHAFLTVVELTQFKEGLPIVRRLIHNRKVSSSVRRGAVAVLGKVGGSDVAAELEKLWDDDTLLDKNEEGRLICLGDQALAASIRLAGKKPQDYGFEFFSLGMFIPDDDSIASHHHHYFTSEKARRAAHEKWKSETRKAN